MRFKIQITTKQQNINEKIDPVKISEFKIIPVFRIYISKKPLNLFPEIGFDIDGPAIGLVNNFAKLAAVIGKR
jgi:hypothetical protein